MTGSEKSPDQIRVQPLKQSSVPICTYILTKRLQFNCNASVNVNVMQLSFQFPTD